MIPFYFLLFFFYFQIIQGMFFESFKKVMWLVLFDISAWVFYINGLNCFPTAKLNARLESSNLTLFLMQNSLVFTDVRIPDSIHTVSVLLNKEVFMEKEKKTMRCCIKDG